MFVMVEDVRDGWMKFWIQISERLVIIIKTIRFNLDERLLADLVTSYFYISLC